MPPLHLLWICAFVWVGPLFFPYGNWKIYIHMYALSAPALLMFYATFKLSEGQDIIAAA